MKPASRSIAQIVETQAKKWQARSQPPPGRSTQPPPADHQGRVVTVSAEPGSAGAAIASRVADALQFDFFDRELIHQVAESAHTTEAMIESLDERRHKTVEDWIAALISEGHLWGDDYMEHLIKVLLTIASHGRAVILGRGAAFVIPRDHSLRVRVVAPHDDRLHSFVDEFGGIEHEALKRLKQADLDRVNFIKQHFHAELGDPHNYDLVVNSSRLGVTRAVDLICALHKAW